MLLFIFLLIIPIVLQHVKIKGIDYQLKNRIAFVFFWVMLTFLLMFRHKSVGTDTTSYMAFFDQVSATNWSNITDYYSTEIGFTILTKQISYISAQPQFFIAVTSLLVSVMIFPTYYRLIEDSSLTIVLFCSMSTFVMMFSGIRQMLAIAIGFVAYELTRRKKLVFFILAVALAIMFHTSAFMLIFMYPLYHAKITKNWLYVIVPLFVVCLIFNNQIFGFLTVVLDSYTRFSIEGNSTGAYTMILLFLAFAVISFMIPDENEIDKETVGLRNFLLLAIFIQMFAPLHNLAMRMNYYYIIFLPLLIPKVLSIRKDGLRQVAVVGRHVMVGFFLIYTLVFMYSGGALDVVPYHFFWENAI